MEIISEQITYKNKNFDIKLKPIFQTIADIRKLNYTLSPNKISNLVTYLAVLGNKFSITPLYSLFIIS